MKKRFFNLTCLCFVILYFGCSGTANPPVNTTPEPERRPRPTPVTVTPAEPENECDHFWKRPDCHNPNICYDCGETEGSPIEHVWSTPNFQEPPICILCGDIGGVPLEPRFTAEGFRINTTSGRLYNYKSVTDSDTSITTTGTITLLYIDIFESDVNYPAKAGYEYIVARFMINSVDENARVNGFRVMTGQLDYYNFDPYEPAILYSDFRDAEIEGFKISNHTLNYFNKEYEYYIKHSRIQNQWVDDLLYLIIEYTILVPAGYDGIVIYASNAGNWSLASNRVITDNFDSETLFFRLKTQTN